MLKLLQLAESTVDADEKCILCSVMRLEGSGYGRVGARLLLTESGEREGYVSGGCLERDLCRRAWAEASHVPKLMAFDTRGNSVTPSRYNTGCQGVVYVLCQPIHFNESLFIKAVSRVIHERRIARMLTVYHSQSGAARTGDAMVLFAEGSCDATWNWQSEANALRSLLYRTTEPFTASVLDRNGARIELTIECMEPPPRLVVFGTGDDVLPVVRGAVGLGWDVCVVGRRADTATHARFPGAHIHVGEYSSIPPAWIADSFTHVLSMTHDMASDVALLPMLVDAQIGTIGLLGSKNRLARIISELHRRGTPLKSNQLERIRCPIGLDIGAFSPDEIALSIMAELVALVRGGAGGRLSARMGSIHTHLPHYNWELSQLESICLPVGRSTSDSLSSWPLQHMTLDSRSSSK